MEKLTGLVVHLFGMSFFIAGILANIGDWKSFCLFAIGFLYALARFIFFCIDRYQTARWKNWQWKNRGTMIDKD